ncbi:MAG: serine/threonine protein kinase [Acidobacteria bacterium]|nr:serine/threonine protein kinase [Acidobacteriota bacterium]
MLRPGEQIGPYILTNKIGRGSFGVVWLAEKRTALATTRVALKIPLDDEIDLEEIKQEAALWAQASGHPNIIPIIEANIYDDHIVIASEYASDGSLQDWLKQHGGAAPSMDAAIRMMLGILDGLEHLHTQHIIHRDLKPSNLLLQGQTPRIADFGISRVLKTTSQSVTIAGTTAYMAPEAFDGKRNEQTDLWAAGVIFYQMIAGRLPFPQKDLTSLMGAILSRPPEPLPLVVSNHLQAVIARTLEKNPALRFKSAAEMRAALLFALKQDSQVLHTPLPNRQLALETQPDRRWATDERNRRLTTDEQRQSGTPPNQQIPTLVPPNQQMPRVVAPVYPPVIPFENKRRFRHLTVLTVFVWIQMITTMLTFLIALIDVEPIPINGLVLIVIGLTTTIYGIRCGLLRGAFLGLSVFPVCLLCTFLAIVNKWTPRQAQEPFAGILFYYNVLVVSLAIASLFGIKAIRQKILQRPGKAMQRSAGT